MPYMVLRMNRLPDALTESFQKGKFVAKLSNGAFNCVWIDYVLGIRVSGLLFSFVFAYQIPFYTIPLEQV